MRVVTMALMDCTYYLLAVVSLITAILSGYTFLLAFVAAACLVCMFTLLFLSIPLKLNWSSNLYGHLLRRFMSFLAFMLLVYAICYYKVGFERADGTRPSFIEAIYFSVTSFTTVQYGEFRPLPPSRPLVCIESLMGLVAFVPFFAAFGWLYCQNRLWPQSMEDQATPTDLKLTHDTAVGGWKEIETERTRTDAEERHRRIALVSCRYCGAIGARIDKVYDIIGRTTPLALFVAHCSCGATTKPSTTAYMAAWRWTRASKKRHPHTPSASRQQSTSCGHCTGQLVLDRSEHGDQRENGLPEETTDQPREKTNLGGQLQASDDAKPSPQP